MVSVMHPIEEKPVTSQLAAPPRGRPSFEGRPLPHPDEPPYDQGLQFDIETLIDRRRVLKLIGYGAATIGLAACTPAATPAATGLLGGTGAPGPTGVSGGATPGTGGECAVIPEETAGPFPGDGSNGPDLLSQSGVVRQDIRSSFGSSSAVAPGTILRINLILQDLANGCAPLAGAAAYVWHCDQVGRYSMYSAGAENENYLRGVQESDEDGVVTFTSIFPACYPGRWPHIHFEVYPSLAAATDVANKIATSQVALPKDICEQVYATSGYESSVSTLADVSLEDDGVFGEDDGIRQLGTVSGSVASGLTVDLVVPVSTA
jgi:protocatechuate 3,4-dioxygenase beta subunit